MAVHLDIRPRLTFPAEPRTARRRRFRLPPLVLPALGYWLAMAALTYGFTRLGPNPLDDAPSVVPVAREEAASARELPSRPSGGVDAELPLPPPPEPAPAAPTAAPSLPDEATTDMAPEPEPQRAPEPPTSSGTSALAPRQTVATEPAATQPRREAAPSQLTFPEFTDSSRQASREHAADGPRIDSIFERAEALPAPTPKTPPPVEHNPDAAPVSSSCEAAIARNNEQITIGASRGAPDISREAYASILQNGRYLSGCAIPERAAVEICAAVRDGRAVGITVVSSPASPQLNACVRNAVAHLKFPPNARLDVTHTRFDAIHH